MSDTPLYDELEEKWDAVDSIRALCDPYTQYRHIATGSVWYEDSEGNEVFPESQHHSTATEFAGGGIVQGDRPNLYPEGLHYDYCPASLIPKRRKVKLFGRNQDCQGCV